MGMQATTRSLAGTTLLLAGFLGCLGCSRSAGERRLLTGRVTLNGQPVSGGTLRFYPAAARLREQAAYQVRIRPDGSYTAAGVPLGKMKVTVDTRIVQATAEALEQMTASAGKTRVPAPPFSPPGAYVEVPAKYTNPKTTDLRVEVTGGEQQQDFALDGKGTP
jgi:hypothetical protein